MRASSPEAADLAACRTLLCDGSRSFFAASRLLPRRVAEPAMALYAFCRVADDAVDADGSSADASGHGAVAALGHRLDAVYAGAPRDHAADRAFAAMVARCELPRALPAALLEGFAWDADGRRYETLDALLDYAARVAGSVGAMMAVLMGVRGADALARACDLGVAMQLTNIARDVGEDARMGRLYLPLAWLREAGVDGAALLSRPRFDERLGAVIGRLLDVAEALYRRGAGGIRLLPADCRPGIRAAGLIYRDIGRTIARNGHDSVGGRARVTGARKAALMARSLPAVLPLPAVRRLPAVLPLPGLLPLPACRFLVEAATRTPSRRQTAAIGARVDWVFDLFERLHREQWGVP